MPSKMKKSEGKDIKDYYDEKRKDWYDLDIPFESAKRVHKENIDRLKNAENWRKQKDTPITITVLHGSGRHALRSCAQEASTTAMLCERGIELALQETDVKPTIWRYNLREMMLEPCNACYSTTSALCNFSCSCFPSDDISTKIYPAIMASDILFMSTPVNQSMISTRLKIVLDRLISLDGGYFIEELPVKDDVWRSKMIDLSIKEPRYDQRMFGKIAAYFVTSKDLNNDQPSSTKYPREFKNLTYTDLVVGALANQGTEYGWFHANPFYVMAAANPDVEMAYDKAEYDKKTKYHEEAKEVVLAAIAKAKEFREKPPVFEHGGRINRS